MMSSSLNKRYLIKLLSNIVSGAVNIATMAIVPQALGPTAFGQFSYLQQFFSQILAFLDAGTSTAFFTKVSADQDRKELVSYYAFFSLGLFLLLGFFVYLIDVTSFYKVVVSDVSMHLIYFGMCFGYLTWFSQVLIKLSDALSLTVSIESLRIVHKIIFLGLLLLYVSLYTFDVEDYFYYNFALLFSFISALGYMFYKYGIFESNLFLSKVKYFSLTKEFYKFSSPLFIFNIVGISVGLFDIWLLQYINGSTETGYYGLAYSIAAICFIFTSAMTPVLTREFAKHYSDSEISKIIELFNKYVPALYSLSVFFSVYIAFNSSFILEFFAGSRFLDARLVLIVMAFYPIHQTYGQITGAVFFASEKTEQYRNISVIFSFVGLALSFIFIYYLKLGALGLAMKMVLIQMVSVNVQLFYNSKILVFKIRRYVSHQLFSLCFFVSVMYCVKLLDIEFNNGLYSAVAEGIIYFLFSAFLSIFFPFIFMTNSLTLRVVNFFRNRF